MTEINSRSLQTAPTIPSEAGCDTSYPNSKDITQRNILTHWLYDQNKQVGTIHYTDEFVFLVSWLNDIGLNDLNRYRDIKFKDVNELTTWLMRVDAPSSVSTTDYPVLREGLEQGLQPDFEQFELTSIPVQKGKNAELNLEYCSANADFKIYKDDVLVGWLELGDPINYLYLADERAIALLQSSGFEEFIVDDACTKFDTLYFRTALQLLNANGFTIPEWLNAPIESESSEAVDNSSIDTNNSIYAENDDTVVDLSETIESLQRIEKLIDQLKRLPNWALLNIAESLNDELQYRADDDVSCLETIAADALSITPSSTCEL